LLQAEGLFVEHRGLLDVFGSNGYMFDPGHDLDLHGDWSSRFKVQCLRSEKS
jgi:hypothetical protein